MPTLLDSLSIRHVAFRWDSTTRVYRAHTLSVSAVEQREDFELADGKKGWVTEGIWLFFSVASDHFERVSPAPASGNDWIDVLNALKDPSKTVEMFPIHDIDDTVKYQVKQAATGRIALLSTRRTLLRPSASIQTEAVERLDDYPTWLRTTRHRT